MTKKNNIFMGLNGKKIDISIEATSEERAQEMYRAIEKYLIEVLRVDLENEWERDDEN